MAKKKQFVIYYSILVGDQEFNRKITISEVPTSEAAESKLKKLCTSTIQIINTEEI